MKKFFMILFVVAALIIIAFVSFDWETKQVEAPKILRIGETVLNVSIADSQSERQKGLSGRIGLAENEGMLFVFDKEGYYGFWMKEMNFPIDIAWLDKDKKITLIEKNVLPETYPKIFNPKSKNLYVLEIKAGFFEKFGIKIGDFAEF